MRALTMAVLIATVSGCAHPYRPESPHPSPERIAELLQSAVGHRQTKERQLELTLELTPRHGYVFAGDAAWVRCLVPQRPDHRRIAYGLTSHRVSAAELHGADSSIEWKVLIERIECGTWLAVCEVTSSGGRVERRSQTLTARGMCNDAGDSEGHVKRDGASPLAAPAAVADSKLYFGQSVALRQSH